MSNLIEVKDLKVHYPIRSGILNRVTDHVRAVDGVNLAFEEGKTYGLVGESGSGKSTIGKAIIGLETITDGQIFYNGEDVSKQARQRRSDYRQNVQMVFQDAMSSFNPKRRIIDIMSEPLRNFTNLTPAEEKKRAIELLEIVGLTEEALYKYPHQFSGGQRQRIGVARAVALNPKLVIADEPVSALDLSVQAQVLNFMKQIQDEYNISYLFISHDLGVVKHMCDEIAIMYRGRFAEYGNKQDIYQNAQHIYTKRLLSAIPEVNPNKREENKRRRQEIAAAYDESSLKYFDNNGRVHDLQSLSNTHSVAVSDLNTFGKEGEL